MGALHCCVFWSMTSSTPTIIQKLALPNQQLHCKMANPQRAHATAPTHCKVSHSQLLSTRRWLLPKGPFSTVVATDWWPSVGLGTQLGLGHTGKRKIGNKHQNWGTSPRYHAPKQKKFLWNGQNIKIGTRQQWKTNKKIAAFTNLNNPSFCRFLLVKI